MVIYSGSFFKTAEIVGRSCFTMCCWNAHNDPLIGSPLSIKH
jgi:hypothetical protein